MNIKNINRSLLFVVVSLIFLATFHNASALTVSPTRIEISGDLGSTITKNITIFNDNKTVNQTYYVTYSNLESQGDQPLFVSPKSDLGTWITSPEKSVLLKAGETKTIPFTIKIPEDTYLGRHLAIVFFSNTPEGGLGTKTGSLVLLTVLGKNTIPVPTVSSTPTSASTGASLTLLSPNGGEKYVTSQQIAVRWKTENINGNISEISLIPNPISTCATYSQTLVKDIPNNGSYILSLPNLANFKSPCFPLGKNFKIKITAHSKENNIITDLSDDSFTIEEFTYDIPTDDSISKIKVASYLGTSNFIQNKPSEISWVGGKNKVRVGLCEDDGSSKCTNIIGWIELNGAPNSSIIWYGNSLKSLDGSISVPKLSTGKYKIVFISEDKDGNYCLKSDLSLSCNSYLTSDYYVIAPVNDNVKITTGSCNGCFKIANKLKFGSRGDEVKRLQELLGVKPDGVFGRGTMNIVKKWQVSNGITPDGIFGPLSILKSGINSNM